MLNSAEAVQSKAAYTWTCVCLVAWVIALNLQTLTITGWTWAVEADINREQAAKVYHVFGSLLFASFAIARFRVPRPPAIIINLFCGFTILSLVAFTWNGPNPLLVNYVFALLAFLVGMQFQRAIPPQMVLRCLRAAAGIIMAALVVKTAIYYKALLDFFLHPFNGHPAMPLYFYGGGPNLEATWIALLCALFLGTRWFAPTIALSLGLSTVYASRTGLFLGAACIGIALVRARKIRVLVCGVAVVVGLALLVGYFVPELYIVSRILSIGDDPGSRGRLEIWAGIWGAFLGSPLVGYGAGNGSTAVERVLEVKFFEGNVHNYYAQVLLDFGLPMACLYAAMAIRIVAREIRCRFYSELGAYLVLFFLAGWIQFRGAEAIAWFVIGLYAPALKLFVPNLAVNGRRTEVVVGNG